MNQLHIYPTSRALRTVSSEHKEQDGFLPGLMRMDEFEQRAILLENKIQIDPLQRILLLRKAAAFEAFEDLNLDLSLVRFFTKSDALFKFFEELAAEQIDFLTLAEADAYAEFGAHLEILERLLENYQTLLEERGYTDKAFIPTGYMLNKGFLQAYESVAVHLEGYLSYFELMLLEKISKEVSLTIHYTTSKFNKKMQERFESLGIILENDQHIHFSMTDKKVLSMQKNESAIDAKVYAVEEREEQVAVAFAKIEEMVGSGLKPKEIVLILPDESFKEHFTLFDRHNNLNFAMGYDYSNGRIYKSLEALYGYWQSFDKEGKKLLERYGFDMEVVEKISASKKMHVNEFFTCIDGLGLHECPLLEGEKKEKFNERVYEKYLHFIKVLEAEELGLKEWLFLWLKALSKVTMDDVRGGKITVMGVLETRSVAYEGVIVVDFNEGTVPRKSEKDLFLNSSTRIKAGLPGASDRESLQKLYYNNLFLRASQVAVSYVASVDSVPSRFLTQLGIHTQNSHEESQWADVLFKRHQRQEYPEAKIEQAYDFTEHNLSATGLKSFLSCKRRFYHRYIDGLGEHQIEQDLPQEHEIGTALHNALQEVYENKRRFSDKDELKKEISIALKENSAGTVLDKYLQKMWLKRLDAFIDNEIERFKEVEVLACEKSLSKEVCGIRLNGNIDRIDRTPEGLEVLDYKSGSYPTYTARTLDKAKDFQLEFYYLLVQNEGEVKSCGYYDLKSGKIITEDLLEQKLERLYEHLQELRETKVFDFEKTEELKECTYCPYTELCGRS